MIPIALVTVLVLAACRGGDAGSTSSGLETSSVPTISGAPDISEVNKTELVLILLEEWCEGGFCERFQKVWFLDSTQRFSDEDRALIRAAVDAPIVFYTDVWEPLRPDGFFPDGEVSVLFRQPRILKKDVIGIDRGLSTGIERVVEITLLFRWDGQDWVRAEPEQVGVTVTSSVS